MKLLLLFLCLLIATLPPVAQAAAPKKPPAPPDHLIPVNPHPFLGDRRYRAELMSRLQLEPPNLPPGFARMIMRPSFIGESAIRLHGGEDEFAFEDAKKFLLTYAVADKNIYYCFTPFREGQKAREEIHVSVITVEISKPLATRLYTLWKRMLLRTRYADLNGMYPVTDGTSFEFGTLFEHGETTSPGAGKGPDLFVDLGISMMDYCKATPAQRPAAEKKIVGKAALLEKYLDQHPLK